MMRSIETNLFEYNLSEYLTLKPFKCNDSENNHYQLFLPNFWKFSEPLIETVIALIDCESTSD